MLPVYFEYTRATVTQVVDGDTVDLLLDLGFKISFTIRARLFLINAPEIHTAAGKAARTFLENLVLRQAPITVRTYKTDGKDKYGRYLVELTGKDGSLNDWMVNTGHAERYKL